MFKKNNYVNTEQKLRKKCCLEFEKSKICP